MRHFLEKYTAEKYVDKFSKLQTKATVKKYIILNMYFVLTNLYISCKFCHILIVHPKVILHTEILK